MGTWCVCLWNLERVEQPAVDTVIYHLDTAVSHIATAVSQYTELRYSGNRLQQAAAADSVSDAVGGALSFLNL